MSKIEDLEIKDYLIKFVIDTTKKSKLFTRVFGKDFASKRLKTNLSTVYTNEFSEYRSGYYSMDDHSITFCTSEKESDKLTVSDVEKSQQATALHEAIHAILLKTPKECKKYKIEYGSGIHKLFNKESEIGRGANEGLTNWICSKLGVNVSSYHCETTLIKQLELAIGEKRVMQMGKGNVSKVLGMKPIETYEILAYIDEIYRINKKMLKETKEQKTTSISKLNEVIATVESKIFDRYFKRDFDEMNITKKMSIKEYKKLKQFTNLMMTNIDDKNLSHFSSFKFLNDFKGLTQTFSESIIKSAEEYFKNGQLTLDNFSKILEQISVFDDESKTRTLIR